MSDQIKLSWTYRLLRRLGFNYSEREYGQVSLWRVVRQVGGNIWRTFLLRMMNWALLEPVNPRWLRPAILRRMGCKVGKGVYIGYDVFVDPGHADLIEIEDNAHITTRCLLLCHQRNLLRYRKGDDASKLPYKLGKIHIGKGAMIGMETMIMPGVTIGEGAIIGAYSQVTKDVPAWTVATGRPAVVVKQVPERPKRELEAQPSPEHPKKESEPNLNPDHPKREFAPASSPEGAK